MKKRFYVVKHLCGTYSVQTRPNGVGELLGNENPPRTFENAQTVCKAANDALESVGLLKNE